MRRGPFIHDRFILCEGYEDASLARALIATTSRHLKPFDVSPIPDLADTAGSGGFEDAIIGSDGLSGFEKIRDVVIVADNDHKVSGNFNYVKAQLAKAKADGNLKHNWAIPDEAGVKKVGDAFGFDLDVAAHRRARLFRNTFVEAH